MQELRKRARDSLIVSVASQNDKRDVYSLPKVQTSQQKSSILRHNNRELQELRESCARVAQEKNSVVRQEKSSRLRQEKSSRLRQYRRGLYCATKIESCTRVAQERESCAREELCIASI